MTTGERELTDAECDAIAHEAKIASGGVPDADLDALMIRAGWQAAIAAQPAQPVAPVVGMTIEERDAFFRGEYPQQGDGSALTEPYAKRKCPLCGGRKDFYKETCRGCRDKARKLIDLPAAQPERARAVPLVPTEAMIDAGARHCDFMAIKSPGARKFVNGFWRAMCDAAPVALPRSVPDE